jgi:hypothetical protein
MPVSELKSILVTIHYRDGKFKMRDAQYFFEILCQSVDDECIIENYLFPADEISDDIVVTIIAFE